MLAKIYSAAVYGVDAYEVEIEVNGAGGDPVIVIVGLPDTAVKESRDRVTTAISNSGYYWPRGRTTINLAPADIKKEGPSFDLPIALGMIAVTEELDSSPFENFSFVGELALDGSVRPVKGVLPVALEARRRGKRALFVPEANALEAAMVDKIDVYGVQNLRETFAFLRGEIALLPTRADLSRFFAAHQSYDVDFSDVKGQGHVKRAIEVAVAGGHNVVMVGPPGSGKSMLAKRIPTIIAPLSLEEAIETTKIHSIAGLLDVEAITRQAADLPGVTWAGSLGYWCSPGGLEHLRSTVAEQKLDRVVIAGCAPARLRKSAQISASNSPSRTNRPSRSNARVSRSFRSASVAAASAYRPMPSFMNDVVPPQFRDARMCAFSCAASPRLGTPPVCTCPM